MKLTVTNWMEQPEKVFCYMSNNIHFRKWEIIIVIALTDAVTWRPEAALC